MAKKIITLKEDKPKSKKKITLTAKNLYDYFQSGSKFYLQVPSFLFAGNDNHKTAARLMEMSMLDYFKHVRDNYNMTLVKYSTFISFNTDNEDDMKKLVKELNKRLRKSMEVSNE